jgi:hypothetical protein
VLVRQRAVRSIAASPHHPPVVEGEEHGCDLVHASAFGLDELERRADRIAA